VSAASPVAGLRVAIVNWRDPWRPDAGGAEQYAWEMARGLAARGAVVRFLTARAPGQSRRDRRDGVTVIRRGGRFSVYPLAAGWLLAHRRSFDAVLDCQNGIPFFTPWVLPRRVPVLCVMHHVHTAQFPVHFPAALARVGQFLEGPVARRAYRRHACVAVSPSTVTAMRARLRWRGPVYLVPNGAPEPAVVAAGPAGQAPRTLVWVGRLVAHKRAGRLLPLAERLRGQGLTIDVVGSGPDAGPLADRVAAAGLGDVLRLRGYLPEEGKRAVVGGALLHLNTSQGEGWGLCVLEAAALGVPTVAYDVDGLRDAVRNGETGWLVRAGDSLEDVTERAVKELADPRRRAEVAAACRAWAAQLSWAGAVDRMAALVATSVRAGPAQYGQEQGRREQGQQEQAWIVSVPGRGRVLAEGPVLGELLRQEHGAALERPATGTERLLGRPDGPP